MDGHRWFGYGYHIDGYRCDGGGGHVPPLKATSTHRGARERRTLMEPVTLLHRLEVERRNAPAHRHLVEARRAHRASRQARLVALLRAAAPTPGRARATQPCGC
jgi:hypothetical protein